MFIFDDTPRFTHPATAFVPTDGGHDAQPFKATFQVMGVTEAAAYDFSDGSSSTAFLRLVFVGFSEVLTADKQPVPYSDRARDALIELPYVRAALVKAYFAGVSKAELGN